MGCSKCGREDESVTIIEKGVLDDKGRAKYEAYCSGCGLGELIGRLWGIPFTIEVPHYPEYTADELFDHGAAINYTAELIDFPLHKE